MSRDVSSLAVSSDAVDDLVGGFRPDERTGVLLPGLDPAADVAVEVAHGAVRGAPQLLRGELCEPASDAMQPNSAGSLRSGHNTPHVA
jgi:hypothetical protein